MSPQLKLLFVLGPMLLFLLATTVPFRLDPPQLWLNGAERGDGVLRFDAPGIALAAPSLALPAQRDQASVRLQVRSAATNQFGPARILSWGHPTGSLVLGQHGDKLIVRLPRIDGPPVHVPTLHIDAVFAAAAQRLIEVQLDGAGLRVHVDGVLRAQRRFGSPPLIGEAGPPRLALGNSFTWRRPWRGEVQAASVSAGTATIDLLGPNALQLPAFRIANVRAVVMSPSLIDSVLNLLVLMPVGALAALALTHWPVVRIVLVWMPLVLLVETAQLFIAGRFPAVSDLVLNLAGVALGALAVRWLRLRAGSRPGS